MSFIRWALVLSLSLALLACGGGRPAATGGGQQTAQRTGPERFSFPEPPAAALEIPGATKVFAFGPWVVGVLKYYDRVPEARTQWAAAELVVRRWSPERVECEFEVWYITDERGREYLNAADPVSPLGGQPFGRTGVWISRMESGQEVRGFVYYIIQPLERLENPRTFGFRCGNRYEESFQL